MRECWREGSGRRKEKASNGGIRGDTGTSRRRRRRREMGEAGDGKVKIRREKERMQWGGREGREVQALQERAAALGFYLIKFKQLPRLTAGASLNITLRINSTLVF